MKYLLTPYAESIEPFVWWEGAFTEQELNWLQQQAINSESQAQVGGASNSENTDQLKRIRRSKISWMDNTSETTWVYEKLAHVVSSLNSQFYRFDLTGFGESMQLTNYDHSENGMYGWHLDYGGNRTVSRKLSLVVQLSDPSEYEGGNLQVMTGQDPVNVRKQRGLIAVFPSYTLHQVTPVTQGCRQSLVAWLSGPSFK